MIELNQLEQLIYIAENKTISKAAKELLISQPALSRSMQRLESDLGVELFDHYKNKIVLNKNGELAVKHAQKIIKSIQTMINDVQDYDQSFHRISIATCSPAPMWDIEPLIKELYPQITIQTAVINQKDLITKLKELDLKKAAKSVGEKHVEMIHVKDINKVTGYIRGGCSPIGMKKQFVTVFDKSAENIETIIVSAGKIGYQIELAPKDLIEIVGAKTAEITAD